MIFKRWEFTPSVEWRLVYDTRNARSRQRGRNLIINKRFCRLREAYCVLSLSISRFVCSQTHFSNVCMMILKCNAFRRGAVCRRLVTRERNYAEFTSFDVPSESLCTEVPNASFQLSRNFEIFHFAGFYRDADVKNHTIFPTQMDRTSS